MIRKHLHTLLYMFIAMCSLSSCIDEEEYNDDPRGNFEALWHIIDEHYCFFDYKQAQ